MALLDLVVYNYFKSFFTVPSLALYAQSSANRIFAAFYGHLIPAVGTFYFYPFGFFGFQIILSFQKCLKKFSICGTIIKIT